jgi:hypothetical protein
MEIQPTKICGTQQGRANGKAYSYKCIKKNRDLSNKQSNDASKLLEKQEQSKPKTRRLGEMIKIRAKINEIKTKQTTQRINETENWLMKDKQD